MKQETFVETPDGLKLYMVKDLVESPKAVIVIVHGLCEHLGRYEYLKKKLNESGFSVYRFDHRGHGKSEGKKVYYKNFEQISDDTDLVVDLAKAENPNTPIFMLGHSMGGYAAACYGTRFPGKVNGFVLSGALTRYNHELAGPLPINEPGEKYIPNSLGDGVCSDPKVIEAYVNDPLVEKQISVALLNTIYDGVNYLKANPKKFVDPVILMHGCYDGLVSHKDSMDFYEEMGSKDKSLRIYANLCHEIFNEPIKDQVIADAVRWIENHI